MTFAYFLITLFGFLGLALLILFLHLIIELFNSSFARSPHLKFIVQFKDDSYAIRRISGINGPAFRFVWEYLDLRCDHPFNDDPRWRLQDDSNFSSCKGSYNQVKKAYEKYFSPRAKLKIKSSKCLKTVEDE